MSTGIHQYFSPTTRLSSHKDTGIGAVATRKANRGMKRVLENRVLRSRNDIPTSLTPGRAGIGQYAADYENADKLLKLA